MMLETGTAQGDGAVERSTARGAADGWRTFRGLLTRGKEFGGNA